MGIGLWVGDLGWKLWRELWISEEVVGFYWMVELWKSGRVGLSG